MTQTIGKAYCGVEGINIQDARLNGHMLQSHRHEFHELVIVVEGSAIHTINGKDYFISPGDVCVLKEEDTHEMKETNHLYLYNIGFNYDHILRPKRHLFQLPGYLALFEFDPLHNGHQSFKSRLQLEAEEIAYLSNLLTRMLEEKRSQSSGYIPILYAYFDQLVVYLSRQYERRQPKKAQQAQLVSVILSFIHQNYTSAVSLETLASLTNLSTNHFLRLFKSTLRQTPMDYINHYRVQKACDLLRYNSQPITNIAMEVGFSDSNYFSRVFKKCMGQTPREYRAASDGPLLR
jgi:AraC family L-rhamnose operon transcriptional activator RhaR/AraC family L-rhamnose operon regulatory protein RhaS